jgi:hypothetical protein
MSSELTSFVRWAIDCYESDSEVTEIYLQNAEDQIFSEKDHKTIKEETKAAKSSMKRTRGALRARLLELKAMQTDKVSTSSEKRDTNAAPIKEILQISPKQRMEQLRQGHIQHLLDVLVWRVNQDCKSEGGSTVTRQDVLGSLNEDEILGLEEWSDWKEIEREYELALRRMPDFELYLLRKHLDWLDSSAGKIEAGGELSFRDSIPGHLKRYMSEASWCDLHGLDAACAALCGGILQEAIRIKMNSQGFSGLGDAIKQACEVGLLTPKAEEASEKVKELRNLAAHGNQEFLEKPEDRKKKSFPLTRELLDTLFAMES